MMRRGPMAPLMNESEGVESTVEDAPVARYPAVPLFLARAGEPTQYWAGARIKIRRDDLPVPHTGILLLRTDSLL